MCRKKEKPLRMDRPCIGPRKAENIIKYREQHGPFQKIEDLLEVDGIGEKSLEKMKDEIIVH